ncbi:hypothetical protein QBC43DRAFT_331541 [Cladorrhinum sp. PSN259]|nr:hypothetical protein QBC43DRAFT_331541 [Cladorrhinum sp. PSN259]
MQQSSDSTKFSADTIPACVCAFDGCVTLMTIYGSKEQLYIFNPPRREALGWAKPRFQVGQARVQVDGGIPRWQEVPGHTYLHPHPSPGNALDLCVLEVLAIFQFNHHTHHHTSHDDWPPHTGTGDGIGIHTHARILA